MKREKWEDKSLAERMAVWTIYREYVKAKDNTDLPFEDADIAWTGCWWDVVKFTFGVKENLTKPGA